MMAEHLTHGQSNHIDMAGIACVQLLLADIAQFVHDEGW
jgi:hypothetical protein